MIMPACLSLGDLVILSLVSALQGVDEGVTLVKLENQAHQAMKNLNQDLGFIGKKRITEINVLEEFSLHEY